MQGKHGLQRSVRTKEIAFWNFSPISEQVPPEGNYAPQVDDGKVVVDRSLGISKCGEGFREQETLMFCHREWFGTKRRGSRSG